MIFDEAIKQRAVSYVPATKVRNNDGDYYAEYGCHSERYHIDAIFYQGYRDTKVFAYLGFPKNNPGKRVPAVVLVHGGLGKAEVEWVKKWNDMGFAAISMDLYGDGPEDDPDNPCGTGKRKHPYAGGIPWDDYGTAFLRDHENAGMYQNVYHVTGAVNLLMQFGQVDREEVGIVGISWGGITALITAGFDDRLRFAVSVYGCGFLKESRTYFHSAYDHGGDPAWDPANFAARAKMPVLLINGNCDPHFSLNASSHTYEVIPEGYLSIHPGLAHSQEAGDSIAQVYDFAQNIIFQDHSFVEILDAVAADGCLQVSLCKNTQVKNAVFYYLETKEIGYGGDGIVWKKYERNVPNSFHSVDTGHSMLAFRIPPSATYFYASLEDMEGHLVSTRLFCSAGGLCETPSLKTCKGLESRQK